MSGNLVEIYKQNIVNAKKQNIESSQYSEKPIMVSGLMAPESRLTIQHMWGTEFELDEKGMCSVLEILGNKLDKRTDAQKQDIMCLLDDIYYTTQEYLGGQGVEKLRGSAYLSAPDCRLKLSEIQGKRIGLCAERAAMAQQMMATLEKEGILANYTTFLTNSHMTVDNKRAPHAFIVFKHNTDPSKQYLFDIENRLQIKPTNEAQPISQHALYPMTEQEFKDFQEGKSLQLKCIYEYFGMTVVDKPRIYGDEEVKQNQTNLDNGENR